MTIWLLAVALAVADAIHAPDSQSLAGCPQYWTPPEVDRWVGDVALGTYAGRLHVFYLEDRNHHKSSQGGGCHFFAHLSAKTDLTDWMMHPDAVPLTEWWQTVGTGTPFVKDGKLCLAYGFHTERVPDWQQLKLPAGATWSESEDGVHFRPTGIFFHQTRNPTVFNLPDGRFGMVLGYGMGGMYVSKDLLAWQPVDPDLPGRGDCPCYFTWNGHHYLLQGFSQMYHSATGKPRTWENWMETAQDTLYEGLSVPMVTEIADGRRLMAGWLRHPHGWGGWLVFRELKQNPDGTLDVIWPRGLATPVKEPEVYRFAAGENAKIVYRTVQLHKMLALDINAEAGTASWTTGGQLSPRQTGADFMIKCVGGLDRPYEVKVAVWYDERHDVTIFDAEIAGRRTLITRAFSRYETETEKSPRY